MKLLIWGTGQFYRKYSKVIPREDIAALIDSAIEKQDSIIDGISVYAPEYILSQEFDYILVLVSKYEQIFKWLLLNNISSKKILTYENFIDILGIEPRLSVSKKSVYDYIEKSDLKTILVVSNNYGLAGAPIAAFNLSKVLVETGFEVVYSGAGTGSLTIEIEKFGIDYLKNLDLFYKSDIFKNIIRRFDYIIINTIVMYDYVIEWINLGVPIFWWIHESDDMWYKGHTIPVNQENVSFLGAGPRVLQKFNQYHPNVKMQTLFYSISEENIVNKRKWSKRRFAYIGGLDYRKATDILVEAISELYRVYEDDFEFYIAGTGRGMFFDEIISRISSIPPVKYLGELSQREIIDLYGMIDVFVCPSRDDPMPIVVSQAMQYEIPCIVTNQVGQSTFIEEHNFGEVIESESVEQLVGAIEKYIFISEETLIKKGNEGKKIFDKYFSENVMKEKILQLLNEYE